MTYSWVESYYYPLPAIAAPSEVAIMVENDVDESAVITVEARAAGASEWCSAMPPGVTNLGGILFYLDIRRGIDYRLRSNREVNIHGVQILPR